MVFVEQKMRLCGALRNVMAVTVSYTAISLVYLALLVPGHLYIIGQKVHIKHNQAVCYTARSPP